jgi:hypothetical protein
VVVFVPLKLNMMIVVIVFLLGIVVGWFLDGHLKLVYNFDGFSESGGYSYLVR